MMAKMIFKTNIMKRISIYSGIVLLALLSSCSKEISQVPADEEYTLSVSLGKESKVTSLLGDDRGIDFKWAEGDSIFVTIIEADSIATLTEEKVKSLQTYIFKLKTGIGSSNATFTSKTFIPSNVMEKGKSYTMFAAYRPTFDGIENLWKFMDWGNCRVEIEVSVPNTQIYDNDNPVQNIGENDVLIGRATDVTLDSTPELTFHHCIGVLKVNIKNSGSSDIKVKSVIAPIQTRAWYTFDGNEHYTYTYQCTLNCKTPVTIAAGATIPFYFASTFYIVGSNYKLDFEVELEDKTISLSKVLPNGTVLPEDTMISTTLDIKTDMSSSGTIPGIGDKDEDDF